MQKIEDIAMLEALYPAPVPASFVKVAQTLTPLYREWVEASRFCILSTVGEEGVHGSPRGDDVPVVTVDNPTRILMPDWMGNNRLDCLRDIVTDGRAALLFMVPGSTTTVRVNGTAWLTDDKELRARFAKGKKLPATVIVFDVGEAYFQCAKALLRSGLWGRDDSKGLPSVGQILAEMSDGAEGGAEYDRSYVERAKPRMW